MTAAPVHLWRLLSWGRTLSRHGALSGIERDPLTPPVVRRLARVARFGARVPPSPAYADAFEAIGPAAIKLGQALATRPDLVGEEAARDLYRLQDALPPAPFAQVRQTLEKNVPVNGALQDPKSKAAGVKPGVIGKPAAPKPAAPGTSSSAVLPKPNPTAAPVPGAAGQTQVRK